MSSIVSTLLVIAERLLIAAAIFAVGYVLARVMRRLVEQLLERIKAANTLGPSIPQLIGSMLYFLILAMAGVVGLVALGVPAELIILAIAAVVLIFSLAMQQSVANFAATVIFLVFQPFRRGELVETMGRVGTVREILLFNTVLELPDHRLVSLPNSKIQDNGVVNYTRLGRIWADVNLNVAYDENLDHVCAVITEIAAQDDRILTNPPLDIFVEDFGERGVRLNVRPIVAPEHVWDVRSDLRARIKSRFDAEGIRFAIILMPAK